MGSQAKQLAQAMWRKDHDIQPRVIKTAILPLFPKSHIDDATIERWLQGWNRKREKL
jgi:hypothetical protein